MALNLENGYVRLKVGVPGQVTIVSDKAILGQPVFHSNLEPFRLAEVNGWEVHFGNHDKVPLNDFERIVFQVEVKRDFIYIARFARFSNWDQASAQLKQQLEQKRTSSRVRTPELTRPDQRKRFGRDKFRR